MIHRLTICIAGLLLGLTAITFGQLGSGAQSGGVPVFGAKVFTTYDSQSGLPLARFYLRILNDNLTFIQTDSGYVADIYVDLYLNKEKDVVAQSRSFRKSITESNYESTNDRSNPRSLSMEIQLEPGQYQAAISLTDKNTGIQANRNIQFRVPRVDKDSLEIVVSDLLFFSRYRKDAEGKIIGFNPHLSSNFDSEDDDLYLYFNTYALKPEKPILVKYHIKDEEGQKVLENSYGLSSDSSFSEHYIRLNRYMFSRNRYQIELSVKTGRDWYVKTGSFSFFWRSAPNTEGDLDLALQQLRYIAEADSVDYFDSRSFKEKRDYFQRFWKRMDPVPETETNELMVEYFRRVNYANKTFSVSGISGWKTDRGRILVKFGPPDDVDRHPFEQETYPYVFWRYYSQQKAFLFIDRSGFGDYVLHPDYYYVEYD